MNPPDFIVESGNQTWILVEYEMNGVSTLLNDENLVGAQHGCQDFDQESVG